MITYYDEADLIGFGKYLLSKEREDLIMEVHSDRERLADVYHSDLENFKTSINV
jgi:hypothetical protein